MQINFLEHVFQCHSLTEHLDPWVLLSTNRQHFSGDSNLRDPPFSLKPSKLNLLLHPFQNSHSLVCTDRIQHYPQPQMYPLKYLSGKVNRPHVLIDLFYPVRYGQ